MPLASLMMTLYCADTALLQLAVSGPTAVINWYRKRLLAKFGVKNTVNLVSLVLREKIL